MEQIVTDVSSCASNCTINLKKHDTKQNEWTTCNERCMNGAEGRSGKNDSKEDKVDRMKKHKHG